MELMSFAEKLRKAMAKELGEAYEVFVHAVDKNNGVQLQGLTIKRNDRNVSPTIYLEPFWEAYERGVPLAELVKKLRLLYQREMPLQDVDMSFFQDFSQVKHRICFQLVHARSNEKLLKEVPHLKYLDLAICFYFIYTDETLGDGTILIRNSHMQLWNTTAEELYELAGINTPRWLPRQIISSESLLREMFGRRLFPEGIDLSDYLPMKVVSNEKRILGAACLLYPGQLEEMAKQLGGNYYILPSSVHEVILLPDGPDIWAEQLKEMIAEVNRTQVRAEEKLSDTLYYFDRRTEQVKMV
ncbi:MAG: hypothetical protein IJ833_10850 [Lachnospiraceae bacterium]|nr:hypothetical protein [Lachnospiraceae bacterium]